MRLISTTNKRRYIYVSIHAPGRGATSQRFYLSVLHGVSIHAPGRGATIILICNRQDLVVSIHAPGRGATSQSEVHLEIFEFQFTHPGGVRHYNITRDTWDAQSFNSRTREGCDIRPTYTDYNGGGFNSRTREGCDGLHPYPTAHQEQFQFTHPGGVRRVRWERLSLLRRFNSRTREGCDPLHLAYEDPDLTFQFTHPGGVRREEGEGELRLF